MKRILITGGLGYVGGRLTKKLSSQFDVTVSSRRNISAKILETHGAASSVAHQDLLSKGRFPKNIDTVIHLASLNELDCVKFPSEAIQVNIDETRIILENSVLNHAAKFIYFSTAHIYGSPLKGEITELTLPVPIHPYAITHKAAEDYVFASNSKGEIHGTIVRLSNSFGAPVMPSVNRWSLLVNDLCRQAVESNKLKLLSNGNQLRDFICLADLEEVMLRIELDSLGTFNKCIYNIGSGISMSVIDMANLIAKIHYEFYGKVIPIELPKNSIYTEIAPFKYNIDRLLSEGVILKNDFKMEIESLLSFCYKHFKRNS